MNCAAIPHELLENQLFGHVRGAYTGASGDQEGLFVAAGRGTVFLDEIGELERSTQAKLLRAIENREVLPVGATRPVSFQARIVTATNKDLAAEVAADRFRADLYYRLNVVSIHLPPLRDRREDIPSLVAMLIVKHAMSLGKRIDGVDNRAMRGLMTAAWPGNVRELDNALERAVLFSESPILTPDDFPPGLISPGDTEDPGDDLRAAVRKYERLHIERVLRECGTTSAKPPSAWALVSLRSIASWKSSVNHRPRKTEPSASPRCHTPASQSIDHADRNQSAPEHPGRRLGSRHDRRRQPRIKRDVVTFRRDRHTVRQEDARERERHSFRHRRRRVVEQPDWVVHQPEAELVARAHSGKRQIQSKRPRERPIRPSHNRRHARLKRHSGIG